MIVFLLRGLTRRMNKSLKRSLRRWMIGKMKMRLLIISGQKRKIKNLVQRKVENILVYNF